MIWQPVYLGEIMCAGFKKPSKGKYSDLEGGKDGLCGEKGSELGLVFGHAYSVLQTGKAENHKLINFRNPWAHREALAARFCWLWLSMQVYCNMM